MKSKRAMASPGSKRLLWAQPILLLYTVIVAYPMIWMISASLKTSYELFKSPWGLPAHPQWANYASAWGEAGIGQCFLVSVIVTALSMFLILAVGSMAAYALARFVFAGRGFIQNAFMSGMMFPVFLSIVPLYIQLANMGLLKGNLQLAALIAVYVAYSLSFTVFILTGFFKSQPQELAEAGLIDGCSHFTVFWRIMLPLAKPGLIAAGIFNFFGIWNEYPLALVLIGEKNLYTLPLGVAKLQNVMQYSTDWGALFAGLVIIVVPTLIVYMIFQRQITEGLTAGAIKG